VPFVLGLVACLNHRKNPEVRCRPPGCLKQASGLNESAFFVSFFVCLPLSRWLRRGSWSLPMWLHKTVRDKCWLVQDLVLTNAVAECGLALVRTKSES
jgi:hypothetical protein